MMATRLKCRDSGWVAAAVKSAIIETNVALIFVALILTSYQSISDRVKLLSEKKIGCRALLLPDLTCGFEPPNRLKGSTKSISQLRLVRVSSGVVCPLSPFIPIASHADPIQFLFY
jgi:hypothetical protein